MKAIPAVLLLVFMLSGCAGISPAGPPSIRLDANALRSEYVGSAFETQAGYVVNFRTDGTYSTNRGERGRYTINPAGRIEMVGDRGTRITMPDGIVTTRADLGIDFTVERRGPMYTHRVRGTDRTGEFFRVDENPARWRERLFGRRCTVGLLGCLAGDSDRESIEHSSQPMLPPAACIEAPNRPDIPGDEIGQFDVVNDDPACDPDIR